MFELWAILGGIIFTWACGMTSAQKNDKADSYLYIKDTPPTIGLYGEAIHLQSFTPTCYMKNGEYPYCMCILRRRPLPDLLKNSTVGSVTGPYYAHSYTKSLTFRPAKTMKPALLYEDMFFSARLLFEAFGSNNFYMGMQNGSKLEV